jgi:hypothetical protein
MLTYAISNTKSLGAQRSTAAAGAINGAGVDISGLEVVWVHVDAPLASAGDTINFTVQHSEDNSSFANVDASILVSPSTGAPATFTQVTDAVAVDQTLQLIRDRLKRYVRVVATTAGTTIDVTFAAQVLGIPKYSS